MTGDDEENIVVIEDLRFRWSEDGPDVLNISSLSVRRGERVFVCGPSGSGKSTLLNLVGGVAIPTAGRVAVMGHDLSKIAPRARDRLRADHVGIIFQMFNLIPYLPIIDNVLLPCRYSTRRAGNLRRRGGNPRDEVHRLFLRLGLAELSVDRPAASLSIGQQQRVAAARALIGGPELIIADEPTSALDADAKSAFLDLLNQECESTGSTLLFVSHDAALAGRFDRVVDLPTLNARTPETVR